MLKLATVFRVMRAIELGPRDRITTGACVARMSKKNNERMNLVAVPCRELYFRKTQKHRYERNDKLTECAWHVVHVSFTWEASENRVECIDAIFRQAYTGSKEEC